MDWNKVQKSLQEYGLSRVNSATQARMTGDMQTYQMHLTIGDICISIAAALRAGMK